MGNLNRRNDEDAPHFDAARIFSTRPANEDVVLVVRMMSGADLNLLDLDPATVNIHDVAYGVSREPRWNGQTRVMDEDELPLVVEQHQHICDLIYGEMFPGAPAAERLWNKIHDTPETLVKDLCAPVKVWLGAGRYKELEHGIERGFRVAFGLPAEVPEEWEIRRKIVDRRAAFNEALHFMGWEFDYAIKECGEHEIWFPIFDMGIWTPRIARLNFLSRVRDLQDKMKLEGVAIHG